MSKVFVYNLDQFSNMDNINNRLIKTLKTKFRPILPANNGIKTDINLNVNSIHDINKTNLIDKCENTKKNSEARKEKMDHSSASSELVIKNPIKSQTEKKQDISKKPKQNPVDKPKKFQVTRHIVCKSSFMYYKFYKSPLSNEKKLSLSAKKKRNRAKEQSHDMIFDTRESDESQIVRPTQPMYVEGQQYILQNGCPDFCLFDLLKSFASDDDSDIEEISHDQTILTFADAQIEMSQQSEEDCQIISCDNNDIEVIAPHDYDDSSKVSNANKSSSDNNSNKSQFLKTILSKKSNGNGEIADRVNYLLNGTIKDNSSQIAYENYTIHNKTICKQSVSISSLLNISGNDLLLKCSICNDTFALYNALSVMSANNKEKLEIKFVVYCFMHAETKKRQHLFGRNFQCKVCREACSSEPELYCHMKGHNKSSLIQCPFCTYNCNRQGFRFHVARHFPRFKCPICGEGSNLPQQFIAHLHNHKSIKLFSCEFCKETFSDMDTLLLHLHVIHPYVVQCPLCNLKFFSFSELEEHRSTHAIKKQIVIE